MKLVHHHPSQYRLSTLDGINTSTRFSAVAVNSWPLVDLATNMVEKQNCCGTAVIGLAVRNFICHNDQAIIKTNGNGN